MAELGTRQAPGQLGPSMAPGLGMGDTNGAFDYGNFPTSYRFLIFNLHRLFGRSLLKVTTLAYLPPLLLQILLPDWMNQIPINLLLRTIISILPVMRCRRSDVPNAVISNQDCMALPRRAHGPCTQSCVTSL